MTKKSSAASEATATPAPATKLTVLINLLSRTEGADLATMMSATGWQAHSVRGAIAGALKKKGLHITSEKIDGRRVWCVAQPSGC